MNRQEIREQSESMTIAEAMGMILELRSVSEDHHSTYSDLQIRFQRYQDAFSKIREEFIYGRLSGDLGKLLTRYGGDGLVSANREVRDKLAKFLEQRELFIASEQELCNEIKRLARSL